ncbi:MAG: radical SAM protein [Ruminococcus sp.]
MNRMLEALKDNKVVLCGIGFQCETILHFLINNQIDVICLLVDKYTLKPEDCYMIPSKRKRFRNSFSEVDMLMDSAVDNVPVKRIDMLAPNEKEGIFLYLDTPESLAAFQTATDNCRVQSLHMSEAVVAEINNTVFSGTKLVETLWETNKRLYSELQLITNCMKRQLKPTIYDFHFEFHLVEHCNLKCAGCTHFAPLAKEEYLSFEEFKSDIKRLSDLSNKKARFINLLGGEPLLHPYIQQFLYCAREFFPDSIIRVVTNGIKLLEMSESFWVACKENNIIIGITEYPIEIDYQERLELIKRKGVQFESFSGDDVPRDEMWRLALDEKGLNRPTENFMRCPRANACVFIKHGKMFNCATMANIDHFNNYFGTDFKLSKDDGIDIYKVKDIDEILSFLATPKPFCRYCNIDNRKYGVRWKVSDFKRDEWM